MAALGHVATPYDLIAIGSGPAGQRAAVQAAKLGRRAAIIERSPCLGGVSANTGTVPSKTLRAAILELTGLRARLLPQPLPPSADIEIDDLLWRTQQVIEHERAVIDDQLRRNRVDVITGAASFVDPHTLAVDDGEARHLVHAERIVIAVGTRPARPAGRRLRRRHRARLRRHPRAEPHPAHADRRRRRRDRARVRVHGRRARRPRHARRQAAAHARLRRRRARRGAAVPPPRPGLVLPPRRGGRRRRATPRRRRA